LKVPEGCAICESTWGNHWAEVEGQMMFFCCNICEIEFRNMIQEVKRRTGWRTIDEIKTKGEPRGREIVATSSGTSCRFLISFNSQGAILSFQERGPQ
jgi:hypothetical protein